MPAFGILRAHFNGRHQVFAVELVDETRFADAGGADEGDGVARFDERGQFFHTATSERAGGEHQRIARRSRGFGKLGFKVIAQINLVQHDHRPRAAVAAHDQHTFESRGVESRVGGGDEKNGFDVRGENLRGGGATLVLRVICVERGRMA